MIPLNVKSIDFFACMNSKIILLKKFVVIIRLLNQVSEPKCYAGVISQNAKGVAIKFVDIKI